MLIPVIALASALTGAAAPGYDAEVARVQHHLDGALELLAARDLSPLRPEQRARRAVLTGVLRSYRDRGLFPQNHDFAVPTPYFADPQTGILCAMGHLIASTGRQDLVDAVVAMDNNVRVAALAGHEGFRAWLEEHGLTLAEAARIQPTYGPPPPPVEPVEAEAISTLAFPGLAVSLVALPVVRFVPQLKASRAGTLVALATGTFAIGSALAAYGDDGRPEAANVTIATGLLNYYLAARTSSRFHAAQRAQRVSVAPYVPAARSQGAGLMLSITF